MLRASFSIDIKPLQQAISAVRQRAHSAAVRAANKTAEDVRSALQAEMREKFFKPTPFILNSLAVQWARRETPTAKVEVRRFGVRGAPAEEALKAQVFGGTRGFKRSEVRLGALGPGGQPVYMMPARFARYDANGNPSRGELTQILSQFGVLNRGDNRAARRGKRTRKARTEYFVIWGRGEGFDLSGNALAPGIYRKASNGRPLPVYFFMKGQPQYRRRLDWFEVAERTVRASAPKHFRDAMARGGALANDPEQMYAETA